MIDLYRQPVACGLQPTLIAYFNDKRAFEFMNESQVKLFMKQLELDKSWRLQTRPVKGFDHAKSLVGMKKSDSLNYTLSHPTAIDQMLPRTLDSRAVEKVFVEEERHRQDSQACFLFRDLWIFPQIDESEQNKFTQSMERHRSWLQQKGATHFKVGYPNRISDAESDNRKEEEVIEGRSLVARQTDHLHDRLAAVMTQMHELVQENISSERDDDLTRVKIRIDQMAFEDQIKSKLVSSRPTQA